MSVTLSLLLRNQQTQLFPQLKMGLDQIFRNPGSTGALEFI